MADLTKDQLRKAGIVTITDSSTGNVSKVTAPNSLEVGLDDPEFKKNLTVHGAATVYQGITGSITKLPDGSSFLRDGTNITTTVGPDGSITIASIGPAASNVGHYLGAGSGLEFSTGTRWTGTVNTTISANCDEVTITKLGGAGLDEIAFKSLPYSLSPLSTGGLTGGTFDGSADISTWAVLKKTQGGLNSDINGLFIDINSETTSSSTATDEILIYKAGSGLRKIALQQVANLANTGFAGSTTNSLTDGNGISDFSFDGSAGGVQVSVEAADGTISSAASGIKVLRVPNNLTNSSGISEFTYNGGSAGTSISLDIASNAGLSFKAQQLALNFHTISTANIDDDDFVPFYDISGGRTGLGKVLYSDFKAGINAGLSFNTPWIDLGSNLQTTSSVALAGDHGASYSVTNVGNDVYFFVSGSKFGKGISARTVSAFAGDVVITGSLYVDSSQILVDGSGYVNFGSTLGNSGYGIRNNSGVLQYKNNSGAWVNFGTTASPVADPDAQYLVLSATSSLNSERVMTVSTGLSYVDSGAGAAYTVSIDDSIVSTLTGSEFSGIVKLNSVTSASNILPIADSTYTIGNENLRWKSISTNQISYEVNAGNVDNYNTINLNADSMPSNRDNSIYIQSVQSVLMALDSNNGNAGNYFAIFNNVGTSSIESTDVTDAVFKVAEAGQVYSRGVITSSAGFSGSLTTLTDGTAFIRGGNNVTVSSGSTGWITITAPTANADSAAQYLVLSATSSLDNERVFTISTGLSSSDNGAGGSYSVSIDDSIVATLSGSTFSGAIITPAISGSLTHLSDGSSYLVAGENISIVSSSAGSVTINSYAAGGGSPGGGNSDKAAQYLVLAATASLTAERVVNISTGLSSSDDGAGNNYTITADNSVVATLTGSQFSNNVGITGSLGVTTAITSPAFSGSLTHLQDGTSYIKAGSSVTITSASNGSITIASTATDTTYTAGDGLDLSGTVFSTDLKTAGGLKIDSTELAVDDSIVATISGSTFTGAVKFNNGLSGSLTHLADGTSYIKEGSNVTVTSASNGSITIASTNTTYTAGDGLDLSGTEFSVDLKSGGGLEIDSTELAIDDSIVATLTGSIFSGNIVAQSGLSGSIQMLEDGSTRYLVGTGSVNISTASSGQIVVSASEGRVYSAGTGLELSSDIFSIDNSVVATVSGSTFTGAVKFDAGLSGSLTHLADGTSYIKAGSNVTITSASNGSITVASTNTTYTAGDGLDLSGTEFSADLKSLGGLKIDSTELAVDDSIVATISGSTFTGAVKFNSGLSGSLTHLVDGTSYLIAGSNITIATGSSGAITVAASGGEITVSSGSTSVSSVTSVDFTNAGILQDLGSGAVALTGAIGPAEDGTYADGLFTTFKPNTPVGTAVDRFNEVLKALSPAPAPDLDNINTAETGVYSKLSFGASNAVGGYTNVAASAGYGSAVDVNGIYQVATSSNNIRVATFAGSTPLTGTLNSDISPSNYSNGNTNYTTSSFGDADQGVLKLMVNGSSVKEIDLTLGSIGAGNPGSGTGDYVNANGSGFILLSQTGSAVFEDAKTLAFFQHRTGQYTVSTDDQRNGWNYVRVLHVLSGSTKETNYMEWVNDSDSNALAASSETIDNFDLGKGIYLSGIQYYISGTADYKVDVSNVYRNVYSGSVSFNVTNCSISDQAIPALDTGSGENNLSVLKVTGSATITATTLLNQTIASSVNVTHPLKSNLSSGGSSTSGGILLYSASNNSTVLFESFKRENYRITSASYDNQASVTAGAATWDSTSHLSSSADQTDGLIFYNEKLYTPINSLLSGDFRNSTDGGSITYAPTANPDYSGLTSGTKTFYRYFQNTAGATKRDISVDIDGSGTIVEQGTANNTTKLAILFKLPDTGTHQSGWLDLSQAFTAGSYSDYDGCLVNSLDSSLDAVNIATFGTQSIGDNKYIVMKVEADASWTGYIDDITVSFGAGTGTTPSEAPALDDIDCDDTGTGTKLSFGSAQSISGYTNSSTTAGFSAVNVNGDYIQTNSGNNLRRAVFDGSTVINGTLNEDVSANGSSYVANAFNSGSFGSIKLEVNGSVIHTTDLTSFSSGNSLNGNSSGFTSLLAATPAEYSSNSVPDYTLIYRTGEFQVGTSDQRNGWNYARVIHSADGVDTTTNYVEWINDPNSDALSSSGELYDNFGSDSTLFYQSGVKYFISCTSSFEYAASNVYKNVYSRSSTAVTSPTRTNISVSQIALNGTGIINSTNSNYFSSLANLDTTVTDCEQKDINVTGSITFSQSTSLLGPYGTGYHTASISGKVSHPMKSAVTTSTFNKSGFLVFSASQTSTKYTTENFDDENYRLISSSLANQASFSTNGWNPEISMNDAGKSGYYDGLLIYNGYLITPKTGAMGNGDFRSARDGGSLQSPDSNVNYSSLALAERNYTRYFENNTTSDVPQVNVMISGSANLVARSGANSGSLGSNTNFHCSIKIPGKTGWLDLARASAGAGNINDGDGSLSGDLTAAVVPTGVLNICTFNGQTQNGTTSGEESIALRITTHKNWTGNLINLKVGY